MSLHHVRLIHGSPPNPSNDRRIGFAIRYIPTDVAQLADEDSATLVRGEDRHRHFVAEPQPTCDLDPEFVALHRTIAECGARILYRGTEIASYNEPKALAQRNPARGRVMDPVLRAAPAGRAISVTTLERSPSARRSSIS